jgi:hypothetical protein
VHHGSRLLSSFFFDGDVAVNGAADGAVDGAVSSSYLSTFSV